MKIVAISVNSNSSNEEIFAKCLLCQVEDVNINSIMQLLRGGNYFSSGIGLITTCTINLLADFDIGRH